MICAVLSTTSSPAHATFPGLNGRIAFGSERDGDFEIYTMNPDGSGVTMLTDNAASDRVPAWSPDGTKLVFSSTRDGGDNDIWVMGADGTNQTQLTFNNSDDFGPTWSADGSKIAFASNLDGDYEIFVMNADGSGLIQLTFNSVFDTSPDWSPDGARIAFDRGNAAAAEIYVMSADGSGQIQLTSNGLQDVQPRWAPDGSRLLFRRDVGFGAGWAELFTMYPDGTGQSNLTNTGTIYEAEGVYSPDGNKIVLNSNQDDGSFDLYIMNSDGSGRVRITQAAGQDGDLDWQGPSCVQSPTGFVAWWPGEGNAFDIVGAHAGAVVGGTFFAPARVGNGFTFDSNDDRVIVPHSTDLDVQASGFTAALWMQGTKTQPEAIATLLEKSHGWTDNTGWALSVFRSNGEPHFALGDGTGFPDIPAGVDVLDGSPHHVAATWESGTMRLYVDGVLRGTLANPTPVNNARDVNLGFTWGGGTPRRSFRGYVDEVQVFDRALFEAEIQAIVNAGAAGVCPPPPPPCVPAPADLIAWWPGEGDATDVVAEHHGTVTAGASFAAGHVNQAFQFDGVDDYVSVPDDAAWDLGTNDFTIHLWVNFDQIKNSMFIYQQSSAGPGGGFEFDYQPGSGQLVFSKDGVGGGLGRVWSPQENLWYHLAVTRTSGTYRLYVDGAQLGSAQFDPSPVGNVTGPLSIGGAPGFFVDGRIDELTMVGRALAPAEIAAIAGAGSAGVCGPVRCVPAPSGLASWWPGDDDARAIAGSVNGVLQNGASIGTGLVLNGFQLDGVDDRVLLPDTTNSLALASFTYDMWVRPTVNPRVHGMRAFSSYRHQGGVNGGALVSVNPEATLTPGGSEDRLIPRFDIYTNAANISIYDRTVTIPVGTWTHLAMTVDDATKQLRGYVNGVPLPSPIRYETQSPFPGTYSGSMQYVSPIRAYIGIEEDLVDHFVGPFTGNVDEVEVHSRALTAAEIMSIVLAGPAGKCKTSAPPVVTAPADASYPCASQVPAAAPEQATATDDVAVVSLTVAETSNGGAGSPASPLILTRTWTATDADGQTATDSQTITVIDDMAPTLVVPADLAATTGPGTEACADVGLALDAGTATANDNCGIATVTVTGTPEGSLFPVGETLVIWTATDAAGNAVIDTQRVVVSCPVGSITGSASMLCNGVTEPAGGATVRLLHEGAPFRSVVAGADGAFAFEDVRLGTYTVAIEAPAGYAVAPDTRLVTLEGSGSSVEPFVFTCLLSDLTGQVNGTCGGQTNGLQGVTVDVFGDDGQGMDVLVATGATDAQGAFRFDDLPLGEYTVGIVTPLGYTTAAGAQTIILAEADGSLSLSPFALTCQTIASEPRSMGYWKHQVNVYLTGKGHAQESLAGLLSYIDGMVEHFNENLVNPVIVYVPNSANTQDKLLQLQQLLTVNKGGTMLERARQQLLALLLNVVSGKISQTEVISPNGATVSQAITHSHDLIVDGIASNDETAKDIGDRINNGQSVPSGMVPVNTRVITYDRLPQSPPLLPTELSLSVTPNPATRDAVVLFTLPGDAPAVLEVVDLAGRMVAREHVGSRGIGVHSFRLDQLGALRPGIYLVRLTQGTAIQVRRMAVIR